MALILGLKWIMWTDRARFHTECGHGKRAEGSRNYQSAKFYATRVIRKSTRLRTALLGDIRADAGVTYADPLIEITLGKRDAVEN